VFAERKVGKVYIPSVCLCARGYQRRIRARRVGKFIYVVEKVLYRLGPPENVGFTRIDYRITLDHWARTRALVRVVGSITWVRGLVHTHSNLTVCFVISKNGCGRMFCVSACTRGRFFAYLSAHVRVMIKGAFHQIGPAQLANRL
jgi:hypothetical protein